MSKVINEIVVNGETYEVEFKNQVVDGDISVQNGKFISKSTNIDKDVIPESDTWGDSRIDIRDNNGNRLAFIQPKQTTTGETDLHIVRDGSNNPNGKVLINGVDIEKINNDLTAKQNATDNSLSTTSKTVVGAINELKSNKVSGASIHTGNSYFNTNYSFVPSSGALCLVTTMFRVNGGGYGYFQIGGNTVGFWQTAGVTTGGGTDRVNASFLVEAGLTFTIVREAGTIDDMNNIIMPITLSVSKS